MNSTKTQHSWEAFLKFYSEQNKGRKTRLAVFEREGDVTNDYWIENGLALVGIDLDPNGELPTVEVLLDGYSHSVDDVRKLKVYYSIEGNEEGLDITWDDGRITVLRFEHGL
ncbi:MAG: DUF5335 family protein [Pyrinomonadaceae bacterium]